MSIGKSLRNFFLGKKTRVQQIPTLTPQQTAQQTQLLDMINTYLQGHPIGQDVGSFEPYATEALTSFEQGIPSILERYNQLGGQSRINPAEMAAIYGAQSNLLRGLATDEANFDRNALMQDRQFLQALMGPAFQSQFENLIKPSQPGYLQNQLAQANKIAMQAMMTMASGGMGNLGSAAAAAAQPRI